MTQRRDELTPEEARRKIEEVDRLLDARGAKWESFSAGKMKYFGAHGTLLGHNPGLYIVEAPDAREAYRRLHIALMLEGRGGTLITEDLQEIKGDWAEVLSDTLDQIRNREKEYYTNLGSEVFYVEV